MATIRPPLGALFIGAVLLAGLSIAGTAGPARSEDAPEVAPTSQKAAPEAAAKVDRKEIEAQVMCTCEDNCGKLLANCICNFSGKMRDEIDALIAQGMTKTEILDALVEKYGHRTLAAPGSSHWLDLLLAAPGSSHWLDLLAWTVPFLALALGAWIVVRVVRRLSGPAPTPATAPAAPAEGDGDSSTASAYERRLEEELSRFEP
jgi:cytochrome c-type biogenesis protein CcmH/NrfF